MTEIGGADCLEAWRAGVAHIKKNGGEQFNLVVTIERPIDLDEGWLLSFDPRNINSDGDCIRDVINTVFPYRMAKRSESRAALYQRYLAAYDRGKGLPRNRGAWGTYFQRLVRFGELSTVNQLETVISKLSSWNHRASAALVFHPTSPALDSPRPRGGPCWQFGELLWHRDDTIDFFVVYRNHDYFNKVLGNFVALGQMLGFICRQSGKKPGRLVCHSAHAYFESSTAQVTQLARI